MSLLGGRKVANMKIDTQNGAPLAEAESPNDTFAQSVDCVQEMLKAGMPWRDILTRLAIAGECLAGPSATVSILILDENGLLRNGASPNLPLDYLRAIDRLKPDPKVGTCAAAAATGCPVITPDSVLTISGQNSATFLSPSNLLEPGACPLNLPEEKCSGPSALIFETADRPRHRREEV